MAGRYYLRTEGLDKLRRELEPRAQQIIDKVAFDIEAGAKDRAPVRTGFLKNSIATEIGKLKNLVKVGAEYGIYVEMGTRRMRARPFLLPGLEQVKPHFLAACKQLFLM